MDQICNKCDLSKPLAEFTKCKPCSNGVRGTCKSCTRKYMVSYQEANLQPLWATTREINGVLYEGNINKHNN
jgi:hypothetical protein